MGMLLNEVGWHGWRTKAGCIRQGVRSDFETIRIGYSGNFTMILSNLNYLLIMIRHYGTSELSKPNCRKRR